MQQELAHTPNRMIRPAAHRVLSDVHVVQPHLVAVDHRERINQRRASEAERLHLVADEHDAGLDGVEHDVEVARSAVRGDRLASALFHVDEEGQRLGGRQLVMIFSCSSAVGDAAGQDRLAHAPVDLLERSPGRARHSCGSTSRALSMMVPTIIGNECDVVHADIGRVAAH